MKITESTAPTVIVEEGYFRWREDLQYGECKDCMFFFPRDCTIQGVTGTCRRYPPTPLTDDYGNAVGSAYPPSFKTDGCGEFKKRKQMI